MRDRIRVMYVIASMGDARAGTERSLVTIISRLNRAEFDPYLVVLQDGDFVQAEAYACPTECMRLYRMFTPRMWRKRAALAARMRALNIDVVQTFATDAHLVGGGAARIAKVPVIISSRRDLGFAYDAKERLYLRIANRYPIRLLANSFAVADRISQIEGIDPERIDVIHNGVENTWPKTAARHSPPSVVMVANLRPVKCVPVLIRAAKEVLRTVPETRFVLVGDGPERTALQRMVTELGLDERFHFAGSQTDVRPYVDSASIGVLTSESEGFSNAILEYMSAGLPVVATAAGGNCEIIQDGKTGFLVPVGDAISVAQRLTYLLRNPAAAIEMGACGRERVRDEFSLDGMVVKHQDYYRRLLSAEYPPDPHLQHRAT